MKKGGFVILLFLILFGELFGQEPYHFMLGSDEFATIDIYDLNQTPDGRYWIATDDGLFSYDGYHFQSYSHDSLLSSSLFNLVLDYSGVLYCNNLNGQIFRIRRDSMELIHQVPDSLLTSSISYDFLPDNSLVVNSRMCYQTDSTGITPLIAVTETMAGVGSFSRNAKGNLFIQVDEDKICEISTTGIQVRSISFPAEMKSNDKANLQFIFLPQGTYVNHNGKYLTEISSLTPSEIQLTTVFHPPGELNRLFTTEEKCWITNPRPGLRILDLADLSHPDPELSLLFQNTLVSTIFEDDQGNILCGTFGEGLMVIPHIDVVESFPQMEETKYSKLSLKGSEGIFLGGFEGNIYEWDQGNFELIHQNETKLVEVLEYFPEEDLLVYDGATASFLGVSSGLVRNIDCGAMKDVVRVGPWKFGIATHNNCIIADFQGGLKAPPKGNLIGSKTRRRVNCLGYLPQNQHFCMGTSKGCFKVDPNGNESELTWQGSSVLASNMVYTNGAVYLGTRRFGILKFEGDSLSSFVNTSSGLLDNHILKVRFAGGRFFVQANTTFQVFDLEGTPLKTLGTAEGLPESRIRDFVVGSGYLWILHRNGVRRIHLAKIMAAEAGLRIKEIRIWENGKLAPESKNLRYKHDENRLVFEVFAPRLNGKDDIEIQYRLLGIEDNWNLRTYGQNKIEYKSLPPGNFKFEVRLLDKKRVTDTRSISVHILSPFWQKWWFFLSLLLILLGIAFLFYRWRLNLHAIRLQQINEVNASRLTAIQSQMNPHFIFNALNSIQDLVLKGDVENSYTYINKFAHLVRKTLNYSGKDFVDFDEELELIELYLSLEKLRFKKDFEYQINRNGVDEIRIPPLIIQPFIENALVHGLLHQEGSKRLLIEFHIGERLTCIVTDNGVGREKAREIKKRKASAHESFSEKAIQKRIDILGAQLGGGLGVAYIDLEENGKATGTKVVLKLPYTSRFRSSSGEIDPS